ncbi:hypothetical protein PS1_003204 [Malus domestica]
MVHQVSVWLQGYEFTSDFHLLAVVGCDMVLGVDWLETLGFIGWNFLLKVMEFSVHGINYRLVGSSTPVSLSSNPSTAIAPAITDDRSLVTHISNLTTSGLPASSPLDFIQDLHIQFSDLFAPPTALPPSCAIDHQIPLLPGTGPVNVRTYRYGHA